MLCISFKVKLNGESVFRLINAKYLLLRLFLLSTWLKYLSKKWTEIFYLYITCHTFFRCKILLHITKKHAFVIWFYTDLMPPRL